MTIIFFGSDPWFSPPVLEALISASHQVVLAVTKGDTLTKFEAKVKVTRLPSYQDKHSANLLTLEPDNLSASVDLSAPVDVIVLAAFGPPFLPGELLDWPKYGALNVHASLLPRHRGASPVFAALADGDQETGVSIMRMTTEIDQGPILGQKKLVITFDTRETLTKKLAQLGGELIVATLARLQRREVAEIPQPAASPTPYTRRLTKDSGRIDWTKSPLEIERFIRAVTPWPGAWAMSRVSATGRSTFGGKSQKLKVIRAHLADNKLIIDEIQLPGKNPTSWKQFIAGHQPVELG